MNLASDHRIEKSVPMIGSKVSYLHYLRLRSHSSKKDRKY